MRKFVKTFVHSFLTLEIRLYFWAYTVLGPFFHRLAEALCSSACWYWRLAVHTYLGWSNRCYVVGSTRVYCRDRDVWDQGNICSPPRIINKHLLLLELAIFATKITIRRLYLTILEQLNIRDLKGLCHQLKWKMKKWNQYFLEMCKWF